MTAVEEVAMSGYRIGQCVLLHLYLVITIGPLLSETRVLIMILIAHTTIITGVLLDANL